MTNTVLMTVGVLFVAALVIVAVVLIVTRHSREVKEPPPAEDPLAALRARYDALYILHEVPGNAHDVRFAGVCSPAVRFYCWIKDDALAFFPVWDKLLEPSLPDIFSIPAQDVICHATQQGLPGRFTVLQYRVGEDVLSLAFSEDASRVFAALLPDKELSHLLEEMYPKSSRNIQDIKESFVSLKELRGEDLITEDEYAAKKKEMLLTM